MNIIVYNSQIPIVSCIPRNLCF